MRFTSLVLCIFSPIILLSQEKNDIGVIAGASYYIGDFNPGTQFYQPSPSLGVIVRHNFNPFFSARAMLTYGMIKGTHQLSDFYLPNNPTSFSKQLIIFEVESEINFISFDSRKTFQTDLSPYLILGLGIASNGSSTFPHIPMGFGVKFSPIGRLTIGTEWRLHKTFYDGLDGYSNITDGRKSLIHNNDWFGIAGIFLTFRLYNNGALCPVYQ